MSSSSRGQTYWCHECDMSVSLLPTLSLLCPHCQGNFIEQMDLDSPPHHNQFSGQDSGQDHFSGEDSGQQWELLSQTLAHLLHPNNPSPLPTSKASIASIPTVRISPPPSHTSDLAIYCPVCKDEFEIDDEVKQLPCNHLYHGDCILPWLQTHNSCPVCRFVLPTEEHLGNLQDGDDPLRGILGNSQALPVEVLDPLRGILQTLQDPSADSEALRGIFGDSQVPMSDGEDPLGGILENLRELGQGLGLGLGFEELIEGNLGIDIGSTLQNIARRHRMVFPGISSGTRMAQVGPTTSIVGPTSSGETVSSRPQAEVDGDAVMSEARGGLIER
ncbi:uncharacterized protein LOC18439315 [Amborella trichopoda]|nr:uncharacterized protein LOC18439315 [Amborella trichopoda]|eukprot:XP_006849546.2 uncharacterized protein LOC18439315 [Amborella trichopoda]